MMRDEPDGLAPQDSQGEVRMTLRLFPLARELVEKVCGLTGRSLSRQIIRLLEHSFTVRSQRDLHGMNWDALLFGAPTPIPIRLPYSLHCTLSIARSNANVSLNTLINMRLVFEGQQRMLNDESAAYQLITSTLPAAVLEQMRVDAAAMGVSLIHLAAKIVSDAYGHQLSSPDAQSE